jgi:hypothetical protein
MALGEWRAVFGADSMDRVNERFAREDAARDAARLAEAAGGQLPVWDVTAVQDEPDGGARPCERNLYGFCRTCGIEMAYVLPQCECSGRDEFTRPESGYCPNCEGWIPVGAGRQAGMTCGPQDA